MERLTYDFCIGDMHCWQVKGADNLTCDEVCRGQDDNGCDNCSIRKAFDRLAAYEDTGLTPEEIIEIKTLKSLVNAVAPYNDPLSISELREIDGEPVWCSKFGWRICYGITDFRGYLCMETGTGNCISMNGYGETWLAYRRKPECGTPSPRGTKMEDEK